MFTGIITDIGTILAHEDRGDTRLVIGTRYDVDGIDLGENGSREQSQRYSGSRSPT